jgi:hypothetical protein
VPSDLSCTLFGPSGRDDALAAQFGERNIFQDVAAIRPGQDFSTAIDDALEQSDVVLAVIGPRWLTAASPEGAARLLEPDDYVRAELAAALARSNNVVPVLVGGAVMPSARELPDELKRLGAEATRTAAGGRARRRDLAARRRRLHRLAAGRLRSRAAARDADRRRRCRGDRSRSGRDCSRRVARRR